uniref:Asparaginase and isoaspartyl peptidase 1 n=1 Tax=Pipistrellus kuhlii TaxID=59472 RepID=A0A7J7RWH8_PIPKU|nr:hypothetical protein mPipKuh1_010225 [Pipistrellus kuhlii]
MDPVVVVHGGAGSRVSPEREERVRQGVARAAAAGYRVLTAGGSALDAVEAAVAALEDDPEFNAGCGSVLNASGDVEMDASIMSGRDLSSGAVSAVRCIANPVRLARLVMEKTPHCLLTSHGAAEFAAAMGVPTVPGEQLVTERSRKHLEREKQKEAQNSDQQKVRGLRGQRRRGRLHHGPRGEHPEGDAGPAGALPRGAGKDAGGGGGAGPGPHAVQAPRPGGRHPARQRGRLGGPLDLRVHGLGGRQGRQAARRRQPWRHQGHRPALSRRASRRSCR